MRRTDKVLRRVLCPARGLLLPSVFLITAGCPYTTSSVLPSHIKTVAIPVFENATTEPGIELAITEAVTEAFENDRHLHVVSEGDADAILIGSITLYERKPLTFDRAEQADEYRLTAILSIEVRDVLKGKPLWKEESLSDWQAYQPGPSSESIEVGEVPQGEESGRNVLFYRLADRILDRTVLGW